MAGQVTAGPGPVCHAVSLPYGPSGSWPVVFISLSCGGETGKEILQKTPPPARSVNHTCVHLSAGALITSSEM